PMSHPVFGVLIARQLEQMWHLLGAPPVFHLIEVGSGDGTLARSIVDACRRDAPGFARTLHCVASDYEPCRPRSADHTVDRDNETGTGMSSSRPDATQE